MGQHRFAARLSPEADLGDTPGGSRFGSTVAGTIAHGKHPSQPAKRLLTFRKGQKTPGFLPSVTAQ